MPAAATDGPVGARALAPGEGSPGRARVVVVGLGPAGSDHLLPAARTALAGAARRFVRTARHPAVADLRDEGVELEALDRCYEAATDLEGAYRAIVDTVVEAAHAEPAGAVAYAVPGSPVVAERTVALLAERDVDVDIVPGLSFVDLAWARAGVDPLGGGRVVDARAGAPAFEGVSGPVLVAQCDDAFTLSEVKLRLLDRCDPATEVTVLARLGRADESVRRVPLADLDRVVEPDHLTSLFVDLGERAAGTGFAALYALTERLRGPGGCPWDAAQTHHSLTRHLLEEAYEVVEAIERLPPDAPGGDDPGSEAAWAALVDELGDLLFQVVIHTVLAAEAGAATMADVVEGIHTKLVRRHPHVFGTTVVDSADEVVSNWEQIKRAERGAESLVAGITPGLPALLFTPKLLRKAAAVGLDPAATLPDAAAVAARVATLATATTSTVDAEAALGEALAALVALAGARDLDAEAALRGWAGRFRDRFLALERLAVERGVDLRAAPAGAVAALWAEAEP